MRPSKSAIVRRLRRTWQTWRTVKKTASPWKMPKLRLRNSPALPPSANEAENSGRGTLAAVLGGRDFAEAPENTAEISHVAVPAVCRDLFQGHAVAPKHELGPIDAHQV